MDASEEGDMMGEDEPGAEQTVGADEADVELHSTPDVADEPDDDADVVEAHTWRAQS